MTEIGDFYKCRNHALDLGDLDSADIAQAHINGGLERDSMQTVQTSPEPIANTGPNIAVEIDIASLFE